MQRILTLLGALAGLIFAAVIYTAAVAQEDDSEEKGRFTRFVEETISTPDRQISLGSIDGLLSSDVRIDRITIADRGGVWLTIENAHLVWSRLALLRGRLDIELLEADRIVASRPPLPSETVDPAASPGFAVPELPVEVSIDRLAVPLVSLAEGLVGAEPVQFSVEGAVQLAEGGLDTDVAIVRTDNRPGRLSLAATFDNGSRQLSVDLRLDEERDGVIANLLGIPGRPALTFTVLGEGPLSNFAADIGLSADGRQLVDGRTTITESDGGTRAVTDVVGQLGPLVPEAYQAYVAGQSTLKLDFLSTADGRFMVDAADLQSGVASLRMTGRFAPDGFPTAITVDGRLDDPNAPVPVPGGSTVDGAQFQVAFGGSEQSWTARFDLSSLDTGTLRAGSASIVAQGVAQNLDRPGDRQLTFDVTGDLSSLSAARPELAEALGDAFQILARGTWTSGEPVTVEIAEIKNPNAAVHFAGTIDGATLDGRYWLNAADIAPFAGLIGQDVAGAVTLDSNGTVEAATGGFALTIDASTEDLSIGNPTIDPLFVGRTIMVGGASRTVDGLRFQDLRVENDNLVARLDGRYDLARSDLAVGATLNDLSVLTERASGEVSFRADIAGEGTSPTVAATISAPRLMLDGRPLTDGLMRFDGRIAGEDVDGSITASGTLDGVVLDGKAEIQTTDDGVRRIDGLRLAAGANALEGFLALLPSGLVDADLRLDAPDVSVVAPLGLVEATGAVNGDIRLQPQENLQSLAAKVVVDDLLVEGNRIRNAAIDVTVTDLFGVPLADGRFVADGIAAGGLVLDKVDGTAARNGSATRFDIAADLAAGRAAATGQLSRAEEGGFDLTLDRFELDRETDLSARLAEPATFAIRGDTVGIPQARILIGDGEIRVEGIVGPTVDLSASIQDLPLAIGNAVMPELGLAGTVSGSLEASGPRNDPTADFDLAGRGLSAAPLRTAGVDAVDVTAEGTYRGGSVQFSAATSVGGGRIEASGTAGDALDVDVTIRDLPAALANAASPGLGARGSVSATLDVGGTPGQPTVAFSAQGRGLGAAILQPYGIGPIAAEAKGRYEAMRIILDSSRATAPEGLTLSASGTVPLAGAGLDLRVDGRLPLTLANPALAERGARVTGVAALDLAASGSIQSPRINGLVTAEGATLVDPETTMRLTDISLRVGLNGDQASIERFSAGIAGGGTVSATGRIGLRPGAGFPLDVDIRFEQARVTDGNIVTAVLSGSLSATGPATGGLSVSGTVDVARAEITIPETLPSSATLLDVRHRLPPPNVARTLERARLATAAPTRDGGATSAVTLDITINAPARVFVRGRGIDAELGGRIAIRGPATAIQPVGSLNLIRGRIDVIGQRITFDSGRVTLVGDLNPYIDFVATARANQITVTAAVTGQASDPQIVLSSTPDLPQDEILAQFLFGRSITDLSPVQIARLAAAAAQLAGGSGADLIGRLRESTGLDDLDIVTDDEGNAAVQAGRYVSENVYLGVTAGSGGQTNVTVNLDITDDLKARAEVGPSSGSSLGIFYEKEY